MSTLIGMPLVEMIRNKHEMANDNDNNDVLANSTKFWFNYKCFPPLNNHQEAFFIVHVLSILLVRTTISYRGSNEYIDWSVIS